MDIGSQIFSDYVAYSKYAKFRADLGRRETFLETVERNKGAHLAKFPNLGGDIEKAYKLVRERKVLPSMRTMQFAGHSVERQNFRSYNCAYLPIDSLNAIREAVYLLLCGTGVGYSVRKEHVKRIPARKPRRSGFVRHTVEDSIEGWANAAYWLLYQASQGFAEFFVDYSKIRPKGSPLSSGAYAPGPGPLQDALSNIEALIAERWAFGTKMTPLTVHDIVCHLSNAVMSGGIRRAAMISLFDPDDEDMLTCKAYWAIKGEEQRYRANNSAYFMRDETTKGQFDDVFDALEVGKSGEPGIFWSNHPEYGTNPCGEIGLREYGLCNLTEINASKVRTKEDFMEAVWAATFLGTLQASYTYFPNSDPRWESTADDERLLGVSITGIASNPMFYDLSVEALSMLEEGARHAVETNMEYAGLIGIAPASRVTTVKPAGTTSALLGCSSGIHAWHDSRYLRNVRVGLGEPVAKYVMERAPELCAPSMEPGKEDKDIVLSIPVEAPKGALLRSQESALRLLDRVYAYYDHWVKPGHLTGSNTHNVSATINIRPDEWDGVRKSLWENRKRYSGISCLPYDDSVYVQAPFESVSADRFKAAREALQRAELDFSQIVETGEAVDLRSEAACLGDSCEIN